MKLLALLLRIYIHTHEKYLCKIFHAKMLEQLSMSSIPCAFFPFLQFVFLLITFSFNKLLLY